MGVARSVPAEAPRVPLKLGPLASTSTGGPASSLASSDNEEPRPLETTRYTRTEAQLKADKLAANAGQCAEVTPFLFVSGREVAEDEAMLRRFGITHIVNCAGLHVPCYFDGHSKDNSAEGGDSALQCEYLTLNMVDSKVGEDLAGP